MTFQEKVDWIFEQHRSTNHYYDKYLPYEFHLNMVAQAGENFIYLITEADREHVRLALKGHDLIEDTRTSYNDVVNTLGVQAADIIYAVSNEKGKNRKERANSAYYAGIRATPYATYVKLCDRIANVQYSKLTKSKMFEMYKKENADFIKSLGYSELAGGATFATKLFNYLKNLFDEQ